jgi:hypothetical protein
MDKNQEISPGKNKLPDERDLEKEKSSARVPGLTDSERDKTHESNSTTAVNEQPDAVPEQKPSGTPYTDENGNRPVRTDQGL